MKRAIITVAAVVVLVGAMEGRANLVPVNSNSVIEDGIEYYIETDKVVYDLGEDVEILYRTTNLRDEQLRIQGGPIMDIVVQAKEGENGRELWKRSWFKAGSTGPAVLVLEPGESGEISDIWRQRDWNGTPEIEDDFQVLPGTYRVSGVLRGGVPGGEFIDGRITLDITIVPEPGSLGLFAFGVLFLKHHNKRRREVRTMNGGNKGVEQDAHRRTKDVSASGTSPV